MMDLETRIKRRIDRNRAAELVDDYASLSPVSHDDEPTNRGQLIEQLLDHLAPVFEGQMPPNGYVYGPAGAGKSAVVTALVTHLRQHLESTRTETAILTSTRAPAPASPAVVYLDARVWTSEFDFYRTVLDRLTDEPVPKKGLGTDTLRSRLEDHLRNQQGVIIAIDHLGEPGTLDGREVLTRVEGFRDHVSWLAIGRAPPQSSEIAGQAAATIQVDAYRTRTLVDIITARASNGFTRGTFNHDFARRIADAADGNAHDALAMVLIAAINSETAGRTEITERDITAAVEEMPDPCVSLGRVLSLRENKQRILRAFVDLDEADRDSVSATTQAISDAPDIELSSTTIKRNLYEIAETGIIELATGTREHTPGRPPSRVVPRFPPTAFGKLYDLR